jgi:hypothetical protein
MLILTNPGTADLISVITGSTAPIDVHASYMDVSTGSPPVPQVPARQVAAITTAATTTIVAGPASGFVRNVKTIHIRNKSTTANNDVTVNYNVGGTLYELFKTTLKPGDVLEYVEGIGFFVIPGVTQNVNGSVTSQTISTADIYIVGSNIAIPAGAPVVGTMYHAKVDMAKTAGTAAPVLTVRIGTAGTTGDAARCSFTFGIGTSVSDTALFEIWCRFRTVGSGTNAVLQGRCTMLPNLATTGFGGTTPIRTVQNTSGGFDSTVANSIIGMSFNGSTAFAGTVQLAEAELVQS